MAGQKLEFQRNMLGIGHISWYLCDDWVYCRRGLPAYSRDHVYPLVSSPFFSHPGLTYKANVRAGRLRSCFKILQLARYGVINWLEMLIYSCVNCAFSPIYALSRTHLMNFKTASNRMDKERYTLRKGPHLSMNRIFPDQKLGG
jgi:hypothetical protein